MGKKSEKNGGKWRGNICPVVGCGVGETVCERRDGMGSEQLVGKLDQAESGMGNGQAENKPPYLRLDGRRREQKRTTVRVGKARSGIDYHMFFFPFPYHGFPSRLAPRLEISWDFRFLVILTQTRVCLSFVAELAIILGHT